MENFVANEVGASISNTDTQPCSGEEEEITRVIDISAFLKT